MCVNMQYILLLWTSSVTLLLWTPVYVIDTQQIVISLVISQLDYANAILNNLPSATIYPLQRIQNQAAKLILNRKRLDSSTQALMELHWLPVKWRIVFKILWLAFKCVNGQAPKYLKEMFILNSQTAYRLRSSNQVTYRIPSTTCVTLGDRAFAVDAPKRWNKLPKEFKECKLFSNFKRKLKTYLFSEAYYVRGH